MSSSLGVNLLLLFLCLWLCCGSDVALVSSSSSAGCRYTQTYEQFREIKHSNIPVYYINMDSATQRRDKFLSMFGCLDPIRIAGVNASDPSNVKKYLSLGLSTIPGVAEHDLGEEEWNGKDSKLF